MLNTSSQTSQSSLETPNLPLREYATLQDISTAVRNCTLCGLHRTRTQAVPGVGSSYSSFMFIGEGPGQNEDEQGLPFVGRAGALLDDLLSSVPIERDHVYITNIIKCRPPSNRNPEQDETKACAPYLERQIELIKPRVIVTLGKYAFNHFRHHGKISVEHGKPIDQGSFILFPTYHPAAALRNSDALKKIKEDIKKLPEILRMSLTLKRNC